VAGNLTAAGQNVTTEGDGRVGRDAVLTATDIILNGAVGRDVALTAESARINSEVGRDVNGSVDRLALGGQAVVAGDVRYASNNDLTRDSGAQVQGRTERTQPRHDDRQERDEGGIGWLVFWLFVSMLLLALALVLLMPRVFHIATSQAMREPAKVLLVGFAASILVPIVIFGLFFTVFGIPLALLALAAWFVLLTVAGPFAAYLLGRYLLRGRSDNAILVMLAGAVLLLILYFIPFLNILVMLAALWFGLGTVLWQARRLPAIRYDMGRRESSSRNIVE
jgi:cytoskeletal protein CcmA (bactofilin family)